MKQFPTQTAALILLAGTAQTASSGVFDQAIELAALNGDNGFTMFGIDSAEYSGGSVSNAGDINGDGIDDLVIGAQFANTSETQSGRCYVIFGDKGIGAGGLMDLSALNGAKGFTINGVDAFSSFGRSVSAAGDVNDDGFDDLIIGAYRGAPNGLGSGESYVVFGAANVGAGGSVEASALDGANGFRLAGVDPGDASGVTVSYAGDLNDDGVDDIVIGAVSADPNGDRSGEAYVVFGSLGIGATGALELSSLNGANGFVIRGADEDDRCGDAVSSAGDINNDGIDDLIIGALNAGPDDNEAGASYIIFGASNVGAGGVLELATLNGANGFVIKGIDADDHSGHAASFAGDINADGVDDVIIGAYEADPNGNISGESYVVFGATGIGAGGDLELASLNGANGFVLNGISSFDRSGYSASAAGDVNGDSIDDLIIGALRAAPNGTNSGQSYVVFGASDIGASGEFELSALSGDNGFVINGAAEGDRSGRSVSGACDLNADGVDDVITSAGGADPARGFNGATYVIFGKCANIADVTGDCLVTAVDLATLISYWGPCPAEPTPCVADLDADGQTGAADLAILIAGWTD